MTWTSTSARSTCASPTARPDQDWRAINEAAHRPSPDDLAAACDRAQDAALAALAGAGLDGDEALAPAERAAQGQDDESGVPARNAEHDVSRYPAQVSSISWHLPADGYTITRAPAPGGCSLDRHGPRGEHAAYRGGGPTMQRAWDEGRTQLGPGEPQAAASSTRQAPGSPRGSARLYRVVQYYGSWPFENDSRVPHGSKSRRRTETFRTLGPVKQPARACQRPCAVPAPERRGLVSVRRHGRAA